MAQPSHSLAQSHNSQPTCPKQGDSVTHAGVAMLEQSTHDVGVIASAQKQALAYDTDRRTVLQGIGVAAVALALPQTVHAKKLAIALNKLPDLQTIGGSATVTLSGTDIIFVRDGANSVKAFSPICRHKQCKVEYKNEDKLFHCGCHKSAYNLSGEVQGGPAKLPLIRFKSKLKGDKILVKLPDPS